MSLVRLLLLPLLLFAVLSSIPPTPAHAETAPTTCAHNPATEIAGRIALDINHDNWPDANEGAQNVTVTLSNIQSGSVLLQTVTTDTEGCYRFARSVLAPGQLHRIAYTGLPYGAHLIHDADGPGPQFEFVALPNEPYETDVVYRPASVEPYISACPSADDNRDVGGMVGIDHNGNHRGDAGEGIAGVMVTLASVSPNNVIAQTVTDANGCYRLPRQADGTTEVPLLLSCLASSAPSPNNIGWGIRPVAFRTSTTPLQQNMLASATTYMYLRAYLPEDLGMALAESYDPDGRQSAHKFTTILTTPNGTFETDFLYRDSAPSAVTLNTFTTTAVPPMAPLWLVGGVLTAIALAVGVLSLRRRRIQSSASL